MLDVPTCTQFELVEPALPSAPVKCADEAVGLALANSPDIREAESTIEKARAAVRAGKLDYVPSIAVVGGYTNQTAADYIQPNIAYNNNVGVTLRVTPRISPEGRILMRVRDDLHRDLVEPT